MRNIIVSFALLNLRLLIALELDQVFQRRMQDVLLFFDCICWRLAIQCWCLCWVRLLWLQCCCLPDLLLFLLLWLLCLFQRTQNYIPLRPLVQIHICHRWFTFDYEIWGLVLLGTVFQDWLQEGREVRRVGLLVNEIKTLTLSSSKEKHFVRSFEKSLVGRPPLVQLIQLILR